MNRRIIRDRLEVLGYKYEIWTNEKYFKVRVREENTLEMEYLLKGLFPEARKIWWRKNYHSNGWNISLPRFGPEEYK